MACWRCRDAIEQHAPASEKANLLAVTQVLTYLRYDDVGLLTILGGTQAMIESPLIDQLFKERYGQQLAEEVRQTARKTARETAHRAILTVLEARFGDVPRDLAEDIESVADEDRLTDLVCKGATRPDLEAFRDEIEGR